MCNKTVANLKSRELRALVSESIHNDTIVIIIMDTAEVRLGASDHSCILKASRTKAIVSVLVI